MSSDNRDTPTPIGNCLRCDDTGLLCNSCGESEAACVGDCDDDGRLCGHYDCPDCKDTGESAPPKKPNKRSKK